MHKPFTLDEARGMLIGLAVGDALGVALTGVPRAQVQPIDRPVGGGPFDLGPGKWTGATSTALCLAQMLRSANGWDAEDAMRRFVNWRDFGYLSSDRAPFGVAAQTGAALDRFLAEGRPYAGSMEAAQSGNGGIVRLAPVVLAYGARIESAQAVAQLQSRLTHASPRCQRVAANMAQVMTSGDFSVLPQPEGPPAEVTDDVMDTIQAAYWALGRGESFRDVALAAVNLGGDAPAAGAVAGQLAGRIHGYSGIPQAWRAMLHDHDKLLRAADDLHALRPIDI